MEYRSLRLRNYFFSTKYYETRKFAIRRRSVGVRTEGSVLFPPRGWFRFSGKRVRLFSLIRTLAVEAAPGRDGMSSEGALKTIMTCCILSLSILSCRTAPPPDVSEEYRLALIAEVGELSLRDLAVPGKDAPRRVPGPAEERYLRFFDPAETFAEAGACRVMGMAGTGPARIGVQCFVPRESGRGTVFLFPGYLDHAGPFLPFIARLVKAGFSVVAADLPGHGFSEGPRGEIASFEEYGKAVDLVIGAVEGAPEGAKPAFPRPWIGLGHSTGATAFFIHLQRREISGSASPFERTVFVAPLVRSARWKLSMIGLSLIRGAVRYLEPNAPHDPLLGSRVFPVSWAERLRDWNEEVGGYRKVRMKGLIVQGREDDVVDADFNLPFLLEKIEGMRAVYVDGAGHVPYSAEKRNREMLKAVLAYLGVDG